MASVTVFRHSDTDAVQVGRLYDYASALKATEKALADVALGRNAELDALLDLPTYVGDLPDLARKIEAIASAWQDEIDAAEEADDRRRSNPFEPDFRKDA